MCISNCSFIKRILCCRPLNLHGYLT
uniref:Uncharacterized protein n=1 Tax=Arundo donax TaxID=35708 RepID=A0A0A8YFP7_ARUDO